MTDVASGVVGPFGQKDRLNVAFEIFVVKFRRSLRRGNSVENGQRDQNRHAYESTTRHSTLHPRCRRSSLYRTSNANVDKLDLAPAKIQRAAERMGAEGVFRRFKTHKMRASPASSFDARNERVMVVGPGEDNGRRSRHRYVWRGGLRPPGRALRGARWAPN